MRTHDARPQRSDYSAMLIRHPQRPFKWFCTSLGPRWMLEEYAESYVTPLSKPIIVPACIFESTLALLNG